MNVRTFFKPVPHRHLTLPRWQRFKAGRLYHDSRWHSVMDRHSERLRDFLTQKKFFMHDSEGQEWHDYISWFLESGKPLFLLQWNLKQMFARTSRKAFAYKDQKAAIRLADDFCKLLDESAVLYPSGGAVPSDILDIGCGNGIITGGLARHFGLPAARVTGVDVYPPNYLLETMTFRQIEPDSVTPVVGIQAYDLAVLSMVLHHSEAPEMLLAEAYAALRPGGYLLIKEHDAPRSLHDFLDVIHIFHEQIFPARTLHYANARNYRTLDEWKRASRIAGFEAENILYDRYERGSANTGNNFILLLRKDGYR